MKLEEYGVSLHSAFIYSNSNQQVHMHLNHHNVKMLLKTLFKQSTEYVCKIHGTFGFLMMRIDKMNVKVKRGHGGAIFDNLFAYDEQTSTIFDLLQYVKRISGHLYSNLRL